MQLDELYQKQSTCPVAAVRLFGRHDSSWLCVYGSHLVIISLRDMLAMCDHPMNGIIG